jgi:uncharacterized protein YgbK (DUF1537 family)
MIQLGCIADDFTGATDLAGNLVLAGFRVVQTIGVPQGPLDGEADAVVVALKSRTIAPTDAVTQSLQALRWLQSQGAAQVYFKYCSTFDSTPQGNIGPVTEALMDALGADFSVTTPAFPDNQRTVFKGHLFVGDVLLSDSGMRHHPLTPMTDANLVRVLQAQCRRRVGLLPHAVVTRGADAIRAEIVRLRASGIGIAVVDAVCNDDLVRLGPALRGMPLLGAGSGLAIGLGPNYCLAAASSATALPVARGARAVLAGSCSQATQRQVASFKASGLPALAIDPQRVASGEDVVQGALAWAGPLLSAGPVLLYSTAGPETVKAIQARLGVQQAGAMVEATLARIAQGLVTLGVGQLVVAGGETSGACVQALGVRQMRIGAPIDPGVPWCHAHAPVAGAGGLHLSLKSGNFGSDDFFTKAFERLAP